MLTRTIILASLLGVMTLGGCATDSNVMILEDSETTYTSTASGTTTGPTGGETAATRARTTPNRSRSNTSRKRRVRSEGKSTANRPSKMKPEKQDVPTVVRAIEPHIDRESVILADEAEIWVSKNYEYDVSVSGEQFAQDRAASMRKFVEAGTGKAMYSSRPKDLDNSDGIEMIAHGNSVAFVRNLKIKCDRKLRVRIAGFGTEPFIKIKANGHVSHVRVDKGASRHDVTRAGAVVIENDRLRYVNREQGVRVASTTKK